MRALCLVAPLLAVSLAESETSQPPKDAADPLAGITDPQSLSQLLQWSLAHQDLDTLHERAEAMRRASGDAAETAPPISGSGGGGLPNPSYSANAAIDAVKPMSAERRAELDALAQTLSPDMVAMMRESLERSLDASLADEEREESLLNLQDLVEDIDNARDFKSIGGFVDVLGLLASEVPTLQAGAAWVVGSAVKNHHELQLHLLAQNALPSLLALLRSHADANVRAKALYALSSLVRNCPEAQAAFGTADGVGALLGVLSAGHAAQPKLVRKALALITDLLRESGQSGDSSLPMRGMAFEAPQNASGLCGAVAECFKQQDDVDAQEKALLALEQLVGAGLLADDRAAGCSMEDLITSLEAYRERCESALLRARASAERGVDGDDGDDDVGAPGACEELLPTAAKLEHDLRSLSDGRA
jgi:hypothetical protein